MINKEVVLDLEFDFGYINVGIGYRCKYCEVIKVGVNVKVKFFFDKFLWFM